VERRIADSDIAHSPAATALMFQKSAIPFPEGGIAVVFGAGGAIGRALVGQLQAGQNFKHVLGFSRASTPAIDLLIETTLKDAADFATSRGEIRLVLDATGFLHDDSHRPEKSWRELQPSHLARSFALNAIGPALIMKHVLPLLPRQGKSVFATLSAKVGSIGENRLGGWYSYRASKAALNQLVRTAAIELGRRHPDSICVALHPGTVDTGLTSPFSKAGLEVQSPDAAAGRLLAVIDRLSPGDSGGFLDHRGERVPW
jgi:NAD(P)-dependent dehydrogenase (short-subunit alcohol dehydrogenase family)